MVMDRLVVDMELVTVNLLNKYGVMDMATVMDKKIPKLLRDMAMGMAMGKHVLNWLLKNLLPDMDMEDMDMDMRTGAAKTTIRMATDMGAQAGRIPFLRVKEFPRV